MLSSARTFARLAWWVPGAALLVLTVAPILLVLLRSVFTDAGPDLSHYRTALDDPANRQALWNTVTISLATVVVSLLVGLPLAWLVARTDLPARGRLRALLLLPYVVPPYLGAIAWINLANPTVGWLNRLADAPVLNIYTVPGIVWVLSQFFYTFVYLSALTALEQADPSLEEAARVSGASPLRVLTTVTLPLIRPAILSGAFLVFAAAAAAFGVPALIGTPGRIHLLTTRIYGYVKTGGLEGASVAAALSAVLFLAAVTTSALADRLAHARRITALTGKPAAPSRIRLGRWRWPAFVFASAVFTLTCLLPMLAIILTSFMQVVGRFEWSNFTLDKYRYVLLTRPDTARGFINSAVVSFGAATLAVVLGTAIAYLRGHPRLRLRGSRALDACVTLPYATPGTILALGLILLWSRPFRLTDTLWILLIAYLAKYLSFAVRALTTNVQQVDITLEEASRTSGAGFWTTIARIWLPLLKPAMLASWFLVFMPAFGELTMSVLLVGPGTQTVGTVLFDLQEYADPPSASVVAVLILTLVLGAYAAATRLAKR